MVTERGWDRRGSRLEPDSVIRTHVDDEVAALLRRACDENR
jgi:hypothetical protein